MNKNYIDPIFQDALNSVPKRIKGEVDRSFDIANRINAILNQKGWSQTDLARKTGKSCTVVSRWLSGTQNFTLRTIALIEEALDTELIQVNGVDKSFNYTSVASSAYFKINSSNQSTYRIPNNLTYYGQEREISFSAADCR